MLKKFNLIVEGILDSAAGERNKNKDLLTNIPPSFESDLKYLIEQGYIKQSDIIKGVEQGYVKQSYVIGEVPPQKFCDLKIRDFRRIVKDQRVLDMFNVDTTSKDFHEAKKDSTHSDEAWYYMGGLKLVLTIVITVSEDPQLKVNRIKDVTFNHTYEKVRGYGTMGEY